MIFPIPLFRQGSVMVEFKLVFKTKVGDEEALAPLKKGVEDGRMGSLKVYPESLKIVREIEGMVSESRPKTQYDYIVKTVLLFLITTRYQ